MCLATALWIGVAMPARSDEAWPPDAPQRFHNHGVAVPLAQKAWGGPHVVTDENGRSLVLLSTILPTNALLVIDAETGNVDQFDVDEPSYMRYSTLSRDGRRWYTTVGRQFREFDVSRRAWSLVQEMPFDTGGPCDGRGMFEAEDGTLWIAFSPRSELFSYNPQTREFTDHGSLNDESWSQLPDGLAMDDTGWLYATIVFQRGNLVAYNPRTGERRQLVEESVRRHAAGEVIYRATDGRVYARLRPGASDPTFPGQWYRLYEGRAEPVDQPHEARAYFDRRGWNPPMTFPDGRVLTSYSLTRKQLVIEDPVSGQATTVDFNYQLQGGANIYNLVAGEDGLIYGSSGTPLMFFSLNPETGMFNRIGGFGEHGGHINAKAVMNGRIYGAVYSSGSLIEYDPQRPWDDTDIRQSQNPRHLYGYGPAVELLGRPFALLAHPDQRHLIMGGNPRRAIAGGGLLIHDTQTGNAQVLQPEQVIPYQATRSLKALPNGDVIGSTTTAAGSGGGLRRTDEAAIYLIDWRTRQVVFHTIPVAGARDVRDIEVAPNGLVFGVTDQGAQAMFVFDPVTRKVIHTESTEAFGVPAGHSNGPRMLAPGPGGQIYALFRRQLVRIDTETFTMTPLAQPPVTVGAGMVIQDGWLYFSDHVSGRGGPAVWSYRLPELDGR